MALGAQEAHSSHSYPLWCKELGLSVDGGVFLQEPALSHGVAPMPALGGSVSWGVFRYGAHRALLSASYLALLGTQTDGSQVVEISTAARQLFGFSAGYDFTWRMLVAGARVGLGLVYAETQSTIYEVSTRTEDEILFIDRLAVAGRRTSAGLSTGFIGGVSAGVEFGQLFQRPETLELRAQGQALLRGERQDFIVGLSLAFWPSGLWLKLPQ